MLIILKLLVVGFVALWDLYIPGVSVKTGPDLLIYNFCHKPLYGAKILNIKRFLICVPWYKVLNLNSIFWLIYKISSSKDLFAKICYALF